MKLDKLNEFPQIGAMLHNNSTQLSSDEIRRRKFLYIEGLIRFLELYAQNEIGNVEVDIQKISLWVNSPYFENVSVYRLTSIEDIYQYITDDLIERHIPLYRFLKLDDYQLKIFENEHREQVIQDFDKDCKDYQCLKCIWYTVEETVFGRTSTCSCPKDEIENKWHVTRRGYHHIESEQSRTCAYITTVDTVEDFIENKLSKIKISAHCRQYTDSARHLAEKWIEKYNHLDNSYIPTFIPDAYKTLLEEDDNHLEDLGRVFRGEQPKDEMRNNLRQAVFLEAMIKFIEIYAQSELGSNYIADISKIAEYVATQKFTFKTIDDIYIQLEQMIYDGVDMTAFCKVDI